MFGKWHHIVVIEIEGNRDNLRLFEDELKDFNKVMTASAICQEIGIQAAFAAATMGAAAYLKTTTSLINAGKWAAALGEEGSATRVAVGALARVGGLSTGSIGAEALTGILSRASAGVLILALRRLTGDIGTKEALDGKDLGTALFLTLLVAWCGSAGAPRANYAPLKFLVEKLPTALSAQGGAQLGMLIFTGVKTWLAQPENRAMVGYLNANRQKFDGKLEELADTKAKEIVDWARTGQHDVAKSVGDAARAVDYSQKMPFFARNFDFVGNKEALRDMSVNAAIYQAKTDFWINIGDCLADLEQAVKAAKQVGK